MRIEPGSFNDLDRLRAHPDGLPDRCGADRPDQAGSGVSGRGLSRPLADADPVVREALERRILELEGASPPDLVDELRRLLRTELTKARCSADQVARLLSIHRRTLNRYLKTEGTGFRNIADEVRLGIVRQLLADTDIPLAEVSAALDFSEPAAFTRAFERWSGFPPSVWRARHRRDGCALPGN